VANHWYYFTNAENMRVFAAILRHRDAWGLTFLRDRNIPEG
jgi:hypothetical protein